MQIRSGPEPGASGEPASSNGAGEAGQSGGAREFYNFLADVEDLVKATTSLTGDDLARVKATLGRSLAAAKAGARQAAAATDHYAHAQPWQAVGAATALGLLLGYALARRP